MSCLCSATIIRVAIPEGFNCRDESHAAMWNYVSGQLGTVKNITCFKTKVRVPSFGCRVSGVGEVLNMKIQVIKRTGIFLSSFNRY
jgi:hypothetical protein